MRKISRDEAIENSRDKYFTGQRCKNGHLCERFVVNRCCTACVRESNKRRESLPKATISRSKAKSLGMETYFTSYPCAHGHKSERLVSTYACIECYKNKLKGGSERLPITDSVIGYKSLKVGDRTLNGYVEMMSKGKACIRGDDGSLEILDIKLVKPPLTDMELSIRQMQDLKPTPKAIEYMIEMERSGLIKFTPNKD